MSDNAPNASTRAKRKYNATNYDQVNFSVRKGGRDLIDAAAAAAGKSRTAYITQAINAQMERDGLPTLEGGIADDGQ